MNRLRSAAAAIRQGERIPMDEVINAWRQARACRAGRSLLERVSGSTFVVGPIRGHAADFAHYLLTRILRRRDVENVVLLGNYIDGAHHSVEVLYLVALLILHFGRRVVPLMGRHEFLYPMTPDSFGSLRNELALRALHSGTALTTYEDEVVAFFGTFTIACVVNTRYFCVSGGPASEYRFLSQINEATSADALREFVLNQPMDEDEERMANGCAFVASLGEGSLRFTFNALCNFASRNHLVSLIFGTEYHISRPEYDSFARPNQYKESIYFPGYVLGRLHPETHLPAGITVFSAPNFCGINRNNACLVHITDNLVNIQEVEMYTKRHLITPARHDHAFSWAQHMLEEGLIALMREIIYGTTLEGGVASLDADYSIKNKNAAAKMRRLCQLLKANGLPLPTLADGDSPHNVVAV